MLKAENHTFQWIQKRHVARYPFMLKVLYKSGIKAMYLHTLRCKYQKTAASITQCESWKLLLQHQESPPQLLLKGILEGPTKAIGQGKEINIIPTGGEEGTVVCSLIIQPYIQKTLKVSTSNSVLLKWINELSKVEGLKKSAYKISQHSFTIIHLFKEKIKNANPPGIRLKILSIITIKHNNRNVQKTQVSTD